MKIDLLYLNEAKRIRLDYLNNLKYISDKEEDIKSYLSKLDDIKKYITENEIEDRGEYNDILLNINKNIDILKDYISVYNDNIKQLDIDQKKLYFNIKDKYKDISDDDIRKQIIEYIKPFDEEFKKKLNNE
ncbi:hypothetical protein [Trichloromonas sp.]|uniref:hypothetical protein n=1 Tax=Trichloromonas sp. TaxID=3069249 RepID=UPI002A479D66|nr:hypothetical protein [Trichloromonas sp.]